MNIIRNIKVPTGNILIVKGDNGKLECLALGDYGKDHNVKCDAMGLSRELDKVNHTKLLPLSNKIVVTISTQYGCSMGCKFCDVPKVGRGINATLKDLFFQVKTALSLHPNLKGERLNIHFARMGEPTWNPNVLKVTNSLLSFKENFDVVHPVVSTMMPSKNDWLEPFLREWMYLKNETYEGNAGLQISINSTDDAVRNNIFNGNALDLFSISDIMKRLPKPEGRKITLNFAVADYDIDAKLLRGLFNPEYFLCKLTPMHKTSTALSNNLKTKGDYTEYYSYKELEENLKAEGFDVLVFIASKEEDLGMITCGNAILSGTLPKVPYKDIQVR